MFDDTDKIIYVISCVAAKLAIEQLVNETELSLRRESDA